MVGSQTANLTPGPSFAHNLGYRCPNDQCEVIFDIYALRPFQWHQEHPNARCFAPCCWALNIRESRRTPTPDFSKCWASPPHLAKVGVRHIINPSKLVVNVALRFSKTMLDLILNYNYIIITWNMLTTKVFLVMSSRPQCLRLCAWNMHHYWGRPWKIGSWTMLALVYRFCKSLQIMNNTTLIKIPPKNHGLVIIFYSHMIFATLWIHI